MRLPRWLRSRTVARGGATAAVSVVLASSLVLTTSSPAAAFVAPPIPLVPAVTAAVPASLLTVGGVLATGGAALVIGGAVWVGANCVSGSGWCPFGDTFVGGVDLDKLLGLDAVGGLLDETVLDPRQTGGLARLYTGSDGVFTGGTATDSFSVDFTFADTEGFGFHSSSDSFVAAVYCWTAETNSLTANTTAPISGLGGSAGRIQIGPDLCGSGGVPLAVDIQSDNVAVYTSGGYYPNPFASETAKARATLTVKQTCTELGTGVTQVLTHTTEPGNLVAPTLGCPVGTVPTETVYELNPAGGPANEIGKVGWTGGVVPPEYQNCIGQSCALWVKLDGQPLSHTNPDAPYWWQISRVTPERVSCMWGSYPVPLTDCDPLKYAYITEYGASADPAREYQPVPAVDPAGQPWPAGDPLPDVETLPEPSPSSSPTPSPSTSVGTPVDPLPYPPPGANPNPDGDPDFLECVGANWSWNPVSWVFLPVKCALVWAFIPSPEVLTDVRVDIETAWEGTPVPEWAGIPEDLIPPASEGGSCVGPAVVLPAPLSVTVHPLDACSPPLSVLAGITKAGLGALFVLGAVKTVISYLGAGVGYNVPGGGDT